jgi:outer membrane protein OmpA-like peptidoglycan-associated protein
MLFLLPLCLVLTGCPHALIERVEKLLPPPGYKPRFNTSSVSLDSLAWRYEQALQSGKVDSSLWFDDSMPPPAGDSRVLNSVDSVDATDVDAAKDAARAVGLARDSATTGSSAEQNNVVSNEAQRGDAGKQADMRSAAKRSAVESGMAMPPAAAMRRFNEILATLPKDKQDSARALVMFAMMNGRSVRYDSTRANVSSTDSVRINAMRDRAERLLEGLPDSTRSALSAMLLQMRSDADGKTAGGVSDGSAIGTGPAAVAGSAVDVTSRRSAPREAPARVHIRSLIDKNYPRDIELQITLVDSTGRAILGCAPPFLPKGASDKRYWFALRDSCNGTATAIDAFSVEEVRESATDPYALAFVIDHSGSMGKVRIRKLREAVRSTLNIIGTNDMITVMPFAGSSGVDIALTSDTSVMRSGMDIENHASIKPGTAIYDATLHAVRELGAAPKDKKKAILMFTDGEDGSSKAKLNDAIRSARDSGVAVYTIAYGLTNEEPLYALATKTGGQFYRIYSTREFPMVFQDIYRSLKNYYRIRYAPPPCAGIHSVRAELRLPEIGIKRLSVQGSYDKSLFTELDTVGSVTFLNIEFATGSADIQPASARDLDEMAVSLLAHPNTVMEIRGHTDDKGSAQTNEKLSLLRADAVARALQQRGVPSSRLRTRGFGSSQPLVPNTSEENRAKNRRTEFVIVSQ